ncbi:unnamed protein product [Danaus chrysippus]|uniref:(African queen) hypothetical protein n=1 Tax=Danaus chrysippus TaxID=151541 RepID=A0A8J2VWM8_9NEOP|nr:unnamed protein product [Danaus chrysippus]
MPKVIELTIEIEIQKVSCPGVWLCQDGRVSLTVFALGTSYQTCLLPPVFPLPFRDVFYFRKRFQESCALNNICCLLKDETIYCELVQWCEDCNLSDCVILAQYLGAMNDVLFPPNMCSTDGVDLLMRRSKEFPGILSPKIEIATKVRIDEVWNLPCNLLSTTKAKECHCSPPNIESSRQRQVCHSAQYHRTKCNKTGRIVRSRSRSRSDGSVSCCSLDKERGKVCRCPKTSDLEDLPNDERLQKLLLESRYIDNEEPNHTKTSSSKKYWPKTPCTCQICKRYHELFHTNDS